MKIFLPAALLMIVGLGANVQAAPPAVEGAYEVELADLTLPANEFGSVILRECDTCDLVTLRVDADSRYVFGGQALPLKEFREAVLNLKDDNRVAATVIYRLTNDRVRMISVSPGSDAADMPALRARG